MTGVHHRVGVYSIGQTPRPDLIDSLGRRLGAIESRVCGLLDGLTSAEIPPARLDDGNGYPLETRLRDGTRVVVDANYLGPRLQEAVSRWDDEVAAHLVLCAGPFAGVTANEPLIVPFEVGAHELSKRGVQSIEIAVPFRAQARPALRKWESAGFRGRVHSLSAKPASVELGAWIREVGGDSGADGWVFDYVGLPSEISETAAEVLDIPVYDLGRIALDALEGVLAGRVEDR